MTPSASRPQHPRWRWSGLALKWEIAIALIVKLILLWLLWQFFFSAPEAKHMHVPEKQVTQHLLSGIAKSVNPPIRSKNK